MNEPRRSRLAQRLLAGLKDFSTRLQIAGGDIRATGLRTTFLRRCPNCARLDSPILGDGCDECGGNGVIRTVNDGTGKGN